MEYLTHHGLFLIGIDGWASAGLNQIRGLDPVFYFLLVTGHLRLFGHGNRELFGLLQGRRTEAVTVYVVGLRLVCLELNHAAIGNCGCSVDKKMSQ